MPIRPVSFTLSEFVVAIALLASASHAVAQPAISQRPSSVSATIVNSPKLYNGVYEGSLKSRICGETDPMYVGRRAFVFEYPDTDDPSTIKGITDATFTSDELVGQERVTTKFHVTITVAPSGLGRYPPAYVVNTLVPGRGTGQATLAITGGSLELNITAVDPLGAALQMKITCGPK